MAVDPFIRDVVGEIETFTNMNLKSNVRIIFGNGQPWFCLKDLMRGLCMDVSNISRFQNRLYPNGIWIVPVEVE